MWAEEGFLNSYGTNLGARLWWFAAGLTLTLWSLRLFVSVNSYSWMVGPDIAITFVSLIVIGYSLLPGFDPKQSQKAFGYLVLALSLVAFFLWSFAQIALFPGYGTDEAAFDQFAALTLLHGHNPYTTSMAPSFPLYRVSTNGYTFLLNGGKILNLSYPAMSFLFYVPLLAIGINIQASILANIAFFALFLVCFYIALPTEVKMLSVIIGGFDVFISYSVGGVTDPLFMPFLLVAAYKWDRYVWETTRFKRYVLPISMGIAMSIKQNSWIIFVFMIVAIFLEARSYEEFRKNALRIALSYAAIALGVLLVSNLPFIFANLHAWVHGVLTPVFTHAVPAGQGPVALTIFSGLGGGSLRAYGYMTAIIGIGSLAAFIATYKYSRYLLFLSPSVILFFSERSFSSYLVTTIPVAGLGAITLSKNPNLRMYKHWAKVLTAVGVASSLILVYAISVPSPLGISILKITSTGQLQTISQIEIYVKNWTDKPIRPHYTIQTNGIDTQFWNVRGPQDTIGPNQGADVVIYAPSFYAEPSLGSGFQVVAFTTSPDTMSVSNSFLPQSWHVGISPRALNTSSWPIGKPLKIVAEVLDQFDRPVNISGIPIYLGQIIYTQSGTQLANAIISVPAESVTGLEGQTPIAGLTNSSGKVTFYVIGTSPSINPTYFEANLTASPTFNSYPYGYSEILAVNFS